LREVPLFAGCSPKELRQIATAGKILSRTAGSHIVREGTGGHAFFLTLAGTVDVLRGRERIAQLGEGEFFGETALLTDHERNATAMAVTDVELFTMTEWQFKAVLMANPEIAYAILRSVVDRQPES